MSALLQTKLTRALAEGVLFLTLSTILLRGIDLLVRGFTAQWLSVHDFGQAQVIIALFEVFIVVAGLGLPAALLRYGSAVTSEGQRAAYWSHTFILTLAFSMPISLGIWFIAKIPGVFPSTQIGDAFQVLAWVLPLAALFNASGGLVLSLFQSEKQFHKIAGVKSLSGIAQGAILITCVWLFGLQGIAIGLSAYLILSSAIYMATLQKHNVFARLDGTICKELLRYSIFVYLSNIISFSTSYADILIVGYLLRENGAALGFYGSAMLIAKGLWILPMMIAQVALPYISEHSNNGAKLTAIYKRMSAAIAALMIPLCIIMYFVGPVLINALFGADFLPASDVLRLLTVSSLIYSFALVPSSLLLGMGDSHVNFSISLIVSAITLVVMVLMTKKFGIEGTAMAAIASHFIRLILAHHFATGKLRQLRISGGI